MPYSTDCHVAEFPLQRLRRGSFHDADGTGTGVLLYRQQRWMLPQDEDVFGAEGLRGRGDARDTHDGQGQRPLGLSAMYERK